MDIVILGISGHLAETKIIPELTNLYRKGILPSDTRVVGFSRSVKHFELPFPYTHLVGSYAEKKDFERLKETLRSDKPSLVYLALPPEISGDALLCIAEVGFASTILVEKPFGTGYEEAKNLISHINSSFKSHQCLKVDHYAGKGVLRDGERLRDFAGADFVEEVIFEIAETGTVGERNGYYDRAGALRDVGQNHLLYMMAVFFSALDGESLGGSREREKVLSLLSAEKDPSLYRFGSYEGYDKIETFFSIPAYVDLADVEKKEERRVRVTLRSGKALSEKWAGIRVRYRSGEIKTLSLEGGESIQGSDAYENVIRDALEGRHEYFLSDKEVLLAWKFIEQVEEIKEKTAHITYPQGSDIASLI
jgi:glucose-6-phosphate 1-dehydrogenase